MKKLLLIIICLAAVISIGIIIGKIYYSPKQVFKRAFNFELPPSSTVENYQYEYSLFNENYFKIKIKFDEKDYDTIESGLKEFHTREGIDEIEPLPNFINTCSWWDMDKENIVSAYLQIMFGKHVKTVRSYAFIVKTQENEYYLYISR